MARQSNAINTTATVAALLDTCRTGAPASDSSA